MNAFNPAKEFALKPVPRADKDRWDRPDGITCAKVVAKLTDEWQSASQLARILSTNSTAIGCALRGARGVEVDDNSNYAKKYRLPQGEA